MRNTTVTWARLAVSIAALLLAGCGGTHGGPERVPLDRVNCARCGMLVSSDANAAQSRVPGEATRFFDDIGCLAVDTHSRAEGTVRYVRLASGDWRTVETASFAISHFTRTPMDYGIVAFHRQDEAKAADRDGKTRAWRDVVTYAEAR
jgi:copper chaperone NosL